MGSYVYESRMEQQKDIQGTYPWSSNIGMDNGKFWDFVSIEHGDFRWLP